MLCKPVCVCSPEFRYYPRAVLISIDRPISRVHRLRKPLLLPRFMAFSSLFLSQFVFEAQAGGRFFRAHCARSNTATITRESETDRETRLEGKGRRIRSSLWIYFVLVRSSTRPEWNVVAASIPIATRRYIGFARYSVHIYIYTHASFSELAFLLFIRGMAPFVSGWQSALDGCAANWWE